VIAGNHRIRKISTDGIVSTWAGGGTTIGVQSVGDYVDASDTAARFYTPCEVSIDQYNNIFVADAYNHRIRKIDPTRMVSTVAGSGESGPDGGGFQNGVGIEAMFKVPTACHVSLTGSIYVGDGENQRVRKITTDNMVSTFAGSGETGFENGPDSTATFDFPRGCVIDYDDHRLYVVDYNNHAIRIVHLSEITGLNPNEFEFNFEIFPNPATHEIHITGTIPKSNIIIYIFSPSGDTIKVFDKGIDLPVNLNVSSLESGVYYVKLVSNGIPLKTEKVIILGN